MFPLITEIEILQESLWFYFVVQAFLVTCFSLQADQFNPLLGGIAAATIEDLAFGIRSLRVAMGDVPYHWLRARKID